MRRFAAVAIAVALLLTGCTTGGPDDPADVSLHLQQRLDAAFNPGPGGTDRPAAAPVRFALPNGWGNLMRRCMNNSGFPAYDYDREDGFTNAGRGAGDSGEEGLAWYACSQQFPQYDTVFVQFSDEQLDELYDYYVDTLVPCAGSLGFRVTELPSRAAFADGGEGQAGWWHPFLSVVLPPSSADVDLLFAECDPYPAAVRP